ncbi:hypothetical protein [Jannaschia formosa]|uniref:hypothetical protein n=1 Tax=Jannaschia formosa TaxID=2259592 RepID=UPI000E1B74CA|nr:hypothetical protein [Jannaschia formosa]TFL16136.1 hypothetical protein DR046_21680 [Jannaschia formosa]
MADSLLITPVFGDASPHPSLPCVVFGAAVQALERLVLADEAAADLADGDPAYRDGTADADLRFDLARDTLVEASCDACSMLYREAAGAMLSGLTATLPEDVHEALVRLGGLALDAEDGRDRTVRLSLSRAADVFERLARVWGTPEIEPDEAILSAGSDDAALEVAGAGDDADELADLILA